MKKITEQLVPRSLLVLAAVIWGFAFVAQREGMEHVGPFLFNAVRFVLGAIALLPFLFFGGKTGRTGRRGFAGRYVLAGTVLFVAASLQQWGLVYTTAGKAGFITGLYLVIIPLFGLLMGKRVRFPVWAAVLVSVGGLYLLTVRGVTQIGAGDLLVLARAFGWAAHVHIVGWLARRSDPIVVASSQFAVCGALSLGVAVFVEPITIRGLHEAWIPIAYAGILSTAGAYTLQVIGQRWVEPAPAGVILSLETVFAALGGWLILGESMTLRMLLGSGMMLLGILLSQLAREERGGPSGPPRRLVGKGLFRSMFLARFRGFLQR